MYFSKFPEGVFVFLLFMWVDERLKMVGGLSLRLMKMGVDALDALVRQEVPEC